MGFILGGEIDSVMKARFIGNKLYVDQVIFLQPAHGAISVYFRMVNHGKKNLFKARLTT